MKSSEAIPLYIVRFMRLDDYPDEEYNYIASQMQKNTFQCMLLTIAGFIMKFNYRK
mgnify:CR=1 FL=1